MKRRAPKRKRKNSAKSSGLSEQEPLKKNQRKEENVSSSESDDSENGASFEQQKQNAHKVSDIFMLRQQIAALERALTSIQARTWRKEDRSHSQMESNFNALYQRIYWMEEKLGAQDREIAYLKQQIANLMAKQQPPIIEASSNRALNNGVAQQNSFAPPLVNGYAQQNSFALPLVNGYAQQNSFAPPLVNGYAQQNSFVPPLVNGYAQQNSFVPPSVNGSAQQKGPEPLVNTSGVPQQMIPVPAPSNINNDKSSSKVSISSSPHGQFNAKNSVGGVAAHEPNLSIEKA
jgi:hypothetical protein